MDNLESQTYEVFEKDPVKYSEYQRAMYYAILDKIPFEEKDTKTMYVKTSSSTLSLLIFILHSELWWLLVPGEGH